MSGVSYNLQTAIEKGLANPGQAVRVKIKSWTSSLTVGVNGSLLIVSSIIKLIDVLTGNNALEPVVRIFVANPEEVASAVIAITQFYTALNLYLRVFKTSQPISKPSF